MEQDTTQAVQAIVSAGTLDGKPLAGTIDLPTLTRMLLVALGAPDVDALIEEMFPDGQEPPPPAPAGEEPAETRPAAEALMVDAVRELRDHLEGLRG